MKKLLTLFALFCTFTAHATLLELSLDKNQYQQGDTVEVQLIASDMSSTLGGFAATVGFDESNLGLQSWAFGNGFDDGLGSFFFADDSTAGELFVEDYADLFADEGVIAANQGVEFVLATITFTALEVGTQTLSLLAGAELVSFDNQLLETLGALQVSFNVAQVPEPAALFLMITGLALLMRRKA